MVWSASGKVLCLWSVFSGTFLGKIGYDKELEDNGGGGWDEPAPRASVAEDIAKLRIHSGKVRTACQSALTRINLSLLPALLLHADALSSLEYAPVFTYLSEQTLSPARGLRVISCASRTCAFSSVSLSPLYECHITHF